MIDLGKKFGLKRRVNLNTGRLVGLAKIKTIGIYNLGFTCFTANSIKIVPKLLVWLFFLHNLSFCQNTNLSGCSSGLLNASLASGNCTQGYNANPVSTIKQSFSLAYTQPFALSNTHEIMMFLEYGKKIHLKTSWYFLQVDSIYQNHKGSFDISTHWKGFFFGTAFKMEKEYNLQFLSTENYGIDLGTILKILNTPLQIGIYSHDLLLWKRPLQSHPQFHLGFSWIEKHFNWHYHFFRQPNGYWTHILGQEWTISKSIAINLSYQTNPTKISLGFSLFFKEFQTGANAIFHQVLGLEKEFRVKYQQRN